jgi:hypothetical protein
MQASAATSKILLAVQRVERDDGAGRRAEFGEQRLRRRDIVGLLGDIDRREQQGGVGGERARHLDGGTLMEIVEAALRGLPSRAIVPRPEAARAACDRAAWRRKLASTPATHGGVRGGAAPL